MKKSMGSRLILDVVSYLDWKGVGPTITCAKTCHKILAYIFYDGNVLC
jgi:hypothetical protein